MYMYFMKKINFTQSKQLYPIIENRLGLNFKIKQRTRIDPMISIGSKVTPYINFIPINERWESRDFTFKQ